MSGRERASWKKWTEKGELRREVKGKWKRWKEITKQSSKEQVDIQKQEYESYK